MKRIRIRVLIGWAGEPTYMEAETFCVEDYEATEDVNGRINQFTTDVIELIREGEYDEDLEHIR